MQVVVLVSCEVVFCVGCCCCFPLQKTLDPVKKKKKEIVGWQFCGFNKTIHQFSPVLSRHTNVEATQFVKKKNKKHQIKPRSFNNNYQQILFFSFNRWEQVQKGMLVEMKGRMVHLLDGSTSEQLYGHGDAGVEVIYIYIGIYSRREIDVIGIYIYIYTGIYYKYRANG